MASLPDPQAIATALGGEVRGNRIAVPSPGHSKQDRGTVLTVDARAPDSLLVHSFNGADPLAIKDDLRRRGLLPERPLWGERAFMRTGSHADTAPAGKWSQTGCYEYDNGAGEVIYRTRRLERPGDKKRFVAERLCEGRWVSGLDGVDRLPYRFTELCAAAERAREDGTPEQPIYFVEGERKADKLASMGFLATAIAFGAQGWAESYGEAFSCGTVIILPDNDVPGRNFARTVKAGIEDYGGKVVVLELPGLPPKGDIIDWQGSADDLRELTAKAIDGPEPDWLTGEAEPDAAIVATPYAWRDPSTLPRRPWLYGRQLLRGSVFLLVAPGVLCSARKCGADPSGRGCGTLKTRWRTCHFPSSRRRFTGS